MKIKKGDDILDNEIVNHEKEIIDFLTEKGWNKSDIEICYQSFNSALNSYNITIGEYFYDILSGGSAEDCKKHIRCAAFHFKVLNDVNTYLIERSKKLDGYIQFMIGIIIGCIVLMFFK